MKENKKWDTYFAQIIKVRLKEHKIEIKPKLGKLPLEADIVVIRTQEKAKTDNHPIWKNLAKINILEFKSINDKIDDYTLETLLVYGMLYKRKHKIPLSEEIKYWLIVPQIKKEFEKKYTEKIKSNDRINGLTQLEYKKEEILIVEYEQLDIKEEYLDLKVFGNKEIFYTLENILLNTIKEYALDEEVKNMVFNLRQEELTEVLEMNKKLKNRIDPKLIEVLGLGRGTRYIKVKT